MRGHSRRRRLLRWCGIVATIGVAGCYDVNIGEYTGDGGRKDASTPSGNGGGTPTRTRSPTATLTPTRTSTSMPPATGTSTPTPTPVQTPSDGPARVSPAEGASGDFFGVSVALDTPTALVGAFRADEPNGTDGGAAYVYERANRRWGRQAKLAPQNGDAGDRFGTSVALDGTAVLVGASADEERGDRAGAAYVFERTNEGWSQQSKLLAHDGDSDDAFGASVALDTQTGTALVGARGDEGSDGDGAGSAYVYRRTRLGWSQRAKLVAEDAKSGDAFGLSVHLDGNDALVGAPQAEDPLGTRIGAAYVFRRANDRWHQKAKLGATDGDSKDGFGVSVSLANGTALVGAPKDEDPNGNVAGAAYVFERSNGEWKQQTKLAAHDGDADDAFGMSVSLKGGTALVGASADEDPNGAGAGSAYLYERTNGEWRRTGKLAPESGDPGDFFGVSAALGKKAALIGASGDDGSNGKGTGAAHVFEV